jgi:DNA-binding IclR family transcriptional regulator
LREAAEPVKMFREPVMHLPEAPPMRTVEKALRLLDLFDETRPAIGLTAIARLTGMDKATVLRMLADLASAGLVEQDPASRDWRLGAGLIRLARRREAAFPVTGVLAPILSRLAERTGETAHASLRDGRELGTVGIAESARTTRVHLEPGQLLPIHATASGIVYAAFARPEVLAELLTRELGAMTPTTPTEPARLRVAIDAARAQGYALADQTMEQDVIGLAQPLFGADGYAIGALAVASPASRMDPGHRASILAALTDAARAATLALGGRIPTEFRIAA